MEAVPQGKPVPVKTLIRVKHLLLAVFAFDFLIGFAGIALVVTSAYFPETLQPIGRELSRLLPGNDPVGTLEAWAIYGQITIMVITILVWFAWLALANRLLDRLGAEQRQFRSLWSLGWYFIPVMKWWKPYHAVLELAQASADPKNWKEQPLPHLVSAWWLLLALTQAFTLISDHQSSKLGADAPSTMVWLLIALSSTQILLVIWMLMVHRLHKLQMKAVDAISA